jgi:Tol biopolymer transport system component
LRQIEELYHSAREREPNERAAFLAQACRGDEELRQELEQLLGAHSSSDNILDRPAADLLASSTITQLTAETQIGPYRIEAPIGAGGMGSVYRAIDTRLGRKVAIKICAQQFSGRFEREARAISSVNHPHVCTLYDVGPNYLVMELVEGETLAARLQKGPLPMAAVLRYAAEIADALAAAHALGIIHRDLKPQNIMITKSGVKVLDFGLAKSPTDETLTATRVVMGTPAYMAPEQLEGKPCDARSDIYALGLVLYEMAVGKRLPQGQPPLMEGLPPQFAHVIERCLESEPENRWQSASDVKRELEWAGKTAGTTQVTAQASESRKGPPRWIWGVAVGVGVGIGLGWAMAHLRQPVAETRTFEQPLVRLDVDLGADVSSATGQGPDVILSPDGTRLVYVSQSRVFTRRLDQPKATALAGTEGAFAPFFSPDGQWVAFFAQGKLKKVSAEGGSAIALCNAPNPRGGSWGEDGNIVAALSNVGGLSRVPSAGGPPTPVTELAQGESTHRWPQILPGGKAVLYTVHTALNVFDGANIEVMSFKDHRRKTLQRGATFGRYLPSGHLAYVNRGALFAVPFNLERLEVRGTPAPLLEEVAYSPDTGSAQFSFSRTGTLVYRSGGAESGMMTIQWLDAAGKTQPLLAKPGLYGRPRVSPDGQRLAIEVSDGSNQDIWVYEWQRDTMTRLTFGGGNDFPIWSPDGRYIAFLTPGGISCTQADGAGKPQLLTQSKNVQYPWSFTPDGKRLAFMETTGSAFQLWTLPVESDSSGLRAGKPEPFLRTSFDERWPSFSPDERWLAYSSNESGIFQVYVRTFLGATSGPGGKWQVSNSGGMHPEWSRNGRELFFRTEDQRIMVADYTVKGDSFAVGKPRVWSEKQLTDIGLNPNYDLAPDGKRIAAIMPAEAPEDRKAQNHVIFLQNFFDEVRRRTATGGK